MENTSFEQRLKSIESTLSELKALMVNTLSQDEDNNLLDVSGAAKLLHKSVDSIYRYTHKKIIPHIRPVGGGLLFNKEELLKWIESYKVKTTEDIRLAADNNLKKYNKTKYSK